MNGMIGLLSESSFGDQLEKIVLLYSKTKRLNLKSGASEIVWCNVLDFNYKIMGF